MKFVAGTVAESGSVIGNNVIVNTKAPVDHDCCIGQHVHLVLGLLFVETFSVEYSLCSRIDEYGVTDKIRY